MSGILRIPDLALGEVELAVLGHLWDVGSHTPHDVHAAVGRHRGISANTVASALKRLYEKGLLERDKVSHSYVYRAAISRVEFQRQILTALSTQFGDQSGMGLWAAFVDLAESDGTDALRQLEEMIAARLADGRK